MWVRLVRRGAAGALPRHGRLRTKAISRDMPKDSLSHTHTHAHTRTYTHAHTQPRTHPLTRAFQKNSTLLEASLIAKANLLGMHAPQLLSAWNSSYANSHEGEAQLRWRKNTTCFRAPMV